MKRFFRKTMLFLLLLGVLTLTINPSHVWASTDVITSPTVYATTTQGGTTDTANLQAVKGPVYVYASGASSSLGQTLTYSYRVDTASSAGSWVNGTSVKISADGVYTVYFRVCDQDGKYDLSSSWTHVAFQINNSLPALSSSNTSVGVALSWQNPDTSQSYNTTIYRLDSNSNYVEGANMIASADYSFANGTGSWVSEQHASNLPAISVARDTTWGNYLKVGNRNNEEMKDTRVAIRIDGFSPFHTYKVKAKIRFPQKDFSTSGLDANGNPTNSGESNNSLIFIVNADNTAGVVHTPNNTSDPASNVAATNFNDGGWHDVYLIFNSQSNTTLNFRFDLWTMAEMDICQPQIVPLTLPSLATTGGTTYTDTTVKDTAAPSGDITAKAVTTSGLTKSLQLSSTATDKGSDYKYQIAAYGNSDGLTRISNICSTTYTSGLKGFYYRLDKSSSSENLSTSNGTFVSYTGGMPSAIEVSAVQGGSYYLHTVLIDNAGNCAPDTVSSITIPGLVSVTLTPSVISYAANPNDAQNPITSDNITLVNNSLVDPVQITLQSFSSTLSGKGVALNLQIADTAAASGGWASIANLGQCAVSNSPVVLGVLNPGGAGHIRLSGSLTTFKWPQTVTDTGAVNFLFTAANS